jgi:hypothetical protein
MDTLPGWNLSIMVHVMTNAHIYLQYITSGLCVRWRRASTKKPWFLTQDGNTCNTTDLSVFIFAISDASIDILVTAADDEVPG